MIVEELQYIQIKWFTVNILIVFVKYSSNHLYQNTTPMVNRIAITSITLSFELKCPGIYRNDLNSIK